MEVKAVNNKPDNAPDITLKLRVTVIDSTNYLLELVDHGDPSFIAICDAFLTRLQTEGKVQRCPETADAVRAFVKTALTNIEFLAKVDEIFRDNARAFDRGHHNIKTWGGETLFKEPPSGSAELLSSARHLLKLW